MSNQKKSREPLLFIQQPKMKPGKYNMQETYSSKRAEAKKQEAIQRRLIEAKAKEENEIKKEVKKKKIQVEGLGLDQEYSIFGSNKELSEKTQENLQKVEKTPEDIQNTINDYEEQVRSGVEKEEYESESFTKGLRKVKSFREMNTEERIQYLVNFPKQLPPVPCMVYTLSETYRGFITGRTEGEINLKLMDQKKKSILIKEIKEIKMAGF
ncbi:CotO family spore coat protein [Cytobacillus sp. FJAT-54145]|uniref:CotO family spore coat protein n=1 Tax=Cytobacillus spartinae TaxID=3299023 RepID=A0ABW6KCH7_9BACI